MVHSFPELTGIDLEGEKMKSFRRGVLAKVAALAPRGSIDASAGGRIAGWALGRGSVRVEACLGGRRLISCEPSIVRAAVAAAYPDTSGSDTCGFAFGLPYQEIGEEFLGELRIVARPTKPWLPSTTLATLHLAGPATARSLASPPYSQIWGPFPRRVIDAIALHWPEDCPELSTAAGQRRFVDRCSGSWLTRTIPFRRFWSAMRNSAGPSRDAILRAIRAPAGRHAGDGYRCADAPRPETGLRRAGLCAPTYSQASDKIPRR